MSSRSTPDAGLGVGPTPLYYTPGRVLPPPVPLRPSEIAFAVCFGLAVLFAVLILGNWLRFCVRRAVGLGKVVAQHTTYACGCGGERREESNKAGSCNRGPAGCSFDGLRESRRVAEDSTGAEPEEEQDDVPTSTSGVTEWSCSTAVFGEEAATKPFDLASEDATSCGTPSTIEGSPLEGSSFESRTGVTTPSDAGEDIVSAQLHLTESNPEPTPSKIVDRFRSASPPKMKRNFFIQHVLGGTGDVERPLFAATLATQNSTERNTERLWGARREKEFQNLLQSDDDVRIPCAEAGLLRPFPQEIVRTPAAPLKSAFGAPQRSEAPADVTDAFAVQYHERPWGVRRRRAMSPHHPETRFLTRHEAHEQPITIQDHDRPWLSGRRTPRFRKDQDCGRSWLSSRKRSAVTDASRKQQKTSEIIDSVEHGDHVDLDVGSVSFMQPAENRRLTPIYEEEYFQMRDEQDFF